jgi:hypothetical protein
MQEIEIYLNPKKSIFVVTKGKLLGHIIYKDGILVYSERNKSTKQISLPHHRK